MTNLRGILSGFGGNYDNELQAKIDSMLAGKASQQDKVEDFLKSELKVDPAKLPLSGKQAQRNLNELLGQRGKQIAVLNGTSLGLKNLTLLERPECPPCDQCGQTDTSSYDESVNLYQCFDCEDANGEYYRFTFVPSETGDVVTSRDGDKQWPEIERIYEALVRTHLDADGRPVFSFRMTYTYYERDDAVEVVKHDVNPDLQWYGTGMTLRLERHVIGGETETVYAKVGGLFSDTEIVALDTMQPIPDAADWRVVEVL